MFFMLFTAVIQATTSLVREIFTFIIFFGWIGGGVQIKCQEPHSKKSDFHDEFNVDNGS